MKDRTTTDQEEILAFLAIIGFPVPPGEGPLRMTEYATGGFYVSRDRAPGEPKPQPIQLFNRSKPS